MAKAHQVLPTIMQSLTFITFIIVVSNKITMQRFFATDGWMAKQPNTDDYRDSHLFMYAQS